MAEDKVHIGFDGIHVEAKDGTKVDIGKEGIHVDTTDEKDAVTMDEDGNVVVKDKEKHPILHAVEGIIPILTVAAFLLIGFIWNLWHPGWVLFIGMAIVLSFIDAVAKKKPGNFPFPMLVAAIYVGVGFFTKVWHPTWIMFFSIPIFYIIVNAVKKK